MKAKIGEMAWLDLSVSDAQNVKDFYQKVVGWQSQAVDMEGYQDYCMMVEGEEQPVGGICHAKGCNMDLPPAWLPYFLVADIEKAVSEVENFGGEMITEVKSMGADKYVVIKDPGGAHCALYQKAND